MGLGSFRQDYAQEDIEKYGKELLDRYGLMPCQEASKLNQSTLSDGSLSSYKPQVRQVIDELGEPNPDIEDVIKVIQESDKNSSTKSIMVSAMRKYYSIVEHEKADEFFREAKKSGIESDAFKGRMEVNEWLTTDEIERINEHILPEANEHERKLESGNTIYYMNHKHKAMFQTLYYTGCRVGEVELLDISDIEFEKSRIRAYRLKKAGEQPKRDVVPIPDEALSTIETYVDKYRTKDGEVVDGPLFDYTQRTIQRKIKEIGKAYKFLFGQFQHTEKLTPHKLRHSRVTAIANDSGLENAGEFVDHSSLETTKGYRHLAAEEQREMLPEEQGDDLVDEVLDVLSDEEISEEKIEKIKKIKDQ